MVSATPETNNAERRLDEIRVNKRSACLFLQKTFFLPIQSRHDGDHYHGGGHSVAYKGQQHDDDVKCHELHLPHFYSNCAKSNGVGVETLRLRVPNRTAKNLTKNGRHTFFSLRNIFINRINIILEIHSSPNHSHKHHLYTSWVFVLNFQHSNFYRTRYRIKSTDRRTTVFFDRARNSASADCDLKGRAVL